MLRFGKIDQIGDSSKEEEKGMYKVRLDDDDIVTGWLLQLKRNAGKNYDDFSYDENEPVAVMLCDDNRTGVILGAMNNKNTEAKETDKDIEQKYFSDDSYVKYDRKNHKYEIYVKGSGNEVNITADDGEVNVVCKNATITATDTVKVDGKLHVTKDATFDGKVDVTGDISGNAKVKATTGIESQGDVKAGGGTISLLTHKHNVTGIGSPTGPSIP